MNLRITLGDLEVHRLGFGAMQLCGPMVYGEPLDPERCKATLRRTRDLGIQLIDTSWYYGPFVANRLIAETLHPYPADLVIATKLGGKRTPDKGWAHFLRPEELRKGCDEDLRTLRLERIDVTHLRWIEGSGVSFLEALDALIALKKEGKIRHLALSNVTVAQTEEALRRTPIVAVQNLYNVGAGERRLARLFHAVTAGQEDMVRLCEEKKMAFLPFFPLAIPGENTENAALSAIAEKRGVTRASLAIAWLLRRSPAMLPIPGTSSPAHLDENCAARDIELTDAEFTAIAKER